jgi:hypothetical protein
MYLNKENVLISVTGIVTKALAFLYAIVVATLKRL